MLVYPCPIYDAVVALMGLCRRQTPRNCSPPTSGWVAWAKRFRTVRVQCAAGAGHSNAAGRLLGDNDGGLLIVADEATKALVQPLLPTSTIPGILPRKPRFVVRTYDQISNDKAGLRGLMLSLLVVDNASQLSDRKINRIYEQTQESFMFCPDPMYVFLG